MLKGTCLKATDTHLGGWLALLAITVRLGASCPPSCSACSREVTLCQRLTYIPEAPASTRALLVTDGSLATVAATNLSSLPHVAVLTLSRNCIAAIEADALHGLAGLRTLLLEHNRLASSALSLATFGALRRLQVLALSHNVLDSVRGAWFRGTPGLLRLLLNGNRLGALTERTFGGGGAALAGLAYLDLSDNVISHVAPGAFGALPGLREVDLSGNRLAHVPEGALGPLTRLLLWSLDRPERGCACALGPPDSGPEGSPAGRAKAPTRGSRRDPKCQSPAAAAGTAVGLRVRRLEADCDSQAPNLTLVFRDKMSAQPGREAAQVTVLCLAGAVALTCLILAIFTWKLQRGKAQEAASEGPCCRAPDGSLRARELRNDLAQGSCNCCLTHENEIQVTSVVGSRKARPLLQERGQTAVLDSVSASTGLGVAFRSLPQAEGHALRSGSFSGFHCVPQGTAEPSGNVAAIGDSSPWTRHFHSRVGKLRHLEPGGIQTQTFEWSSRRTMDISSDTWNGRGSTPTSVLAREDLETHLTNELWQPPTEMGVYSFQPPQQRCFITSSSAQLPRPKDVRVPPNTRNPSSHRHGPRGLPGQSKLMELPSDRALLCKYVSSNQSQDCPSERKSSHREHRKSQQVQTRVSSTVKELLLSEGNVGVSARGQKPRVRKRVSFRLPDVEEENGLALLLTDSAKAGAPWKRQQNQHHQGTSCHREELSRMQEKTKGGKCSSESHVPENDRTRASYPKRKVKGQNLNIKLNLHPFRKSRIHPEKCPPKALKPGQKRTRQRSPQVSEEEAARKERQMKLARTGVPLQQAESSEHLRTAPKPLIPEPLSKPVSGGSQRTRKVAQTVSGVSKSGGEHTCRAPAHILGEGHADTVPGVPPLPKEGMQRADIPPSSVVSYSSGTGQGPARENSKPQHFQVAAEQVTPETPEVGEPHLSQPILVQKESKDPSAPRNGAQLACDFRLDTNQKDLQPEKTLPHKPQRSCPPQRGAPGDATERIIHSWPQTTECCRTNDGSKPRNQSASRVESLDSSLIPQTQTNGNGMSVEASFIPHQKRLQLSNDINTPLLGTQANWRPTIESIKGSDRANGLAGGYGSEALRAKVGMEEMKEAASRSKASGGVGMSEETLKRPKHGPNPVMQSSSVRSSNRPPSEADPQICNHTMRNDVEEVQAARPDGGGNEHEEDTTTGEKQKDAFLFPEVKDSSFEVENEVSLIPSRVNDAENSAAAPTLFLPSAGCANPSPLAAEQSEPNNSTNNGFLR